MINFIPSPSKSIVFSSFSKAGNDKRGFRLFPIAFGRLSVTSFNLADLFPLVLGLSSEKPTSLGIFYTVFLPALFNGLIVAFALVNNV